MTIEQIETFLTVTVCGTISSAAEKLFISQSSVSSRIQQLESELGVSLLIRKKGYRVIELTEAGKAFLPIAEQWISLLKETENIKYLSDVQYLTIASVDAVNNFTLLPLFFKYLEEYPYVKLSINTFHSNEIHDLIASNTMDIGFVFSPTYSRTVVSKPIYRELMYLICHKDNNYYDFIDPIKLDPSKEVYLKWGDDFQHWHDEIWSPTSNYLIKVNTGSMLQYYLQDHNRWAIAPMSVIKAVKETQNLVYYRLKNPPPPRICYQLTNKYPRSSRIAGIEIFKQNLKKFIQINDSICTFEDWMLSDSNRY